MNVSDLHLAYKTAEDALHSLGMVADGVDTAAVNELRYAGKHILDGLLAEDENERDEQFQRAHRHCERAVYEAYDSAIFYYFDQFGRFKDDYRMIVVSEVIADFVSIEKLMQDARNFLETARRNSNARGDYYKQATEWYERVSEAGKRLDAGREELNKKVDQYNKAVEEAERIRLDASRSRAEAETGRRQTLKITIAVAIVTILVNVIFGLL